jgi:tripartite-type tricarboxylate transporter receptor subunit TctC
VKPSRKLVIPLVFLAALVSAATVEAQSYPVKPVRVIIPWPPGGLPDTAGRLIVAKLAESLGQPFIVENRTGATGTIGAEAVAKSAADGYTLMVHSASHISNAHVYPKLPYDTFNDFSPVGLLVAQTGLLVTHPSLPVRSVKDLLWLARSRPHQLLYASGGGGSFSHLPMALLNAMADAKMVHVPYRGGGPATVAVLSGEAQVLIATAAAVSMHIQSSRLRLLAVTSDTRVKHFPNTPTAAESGMPGYEFRGWVAMFAPAGTPKRIVDLLNHEVGKVLGSGDSRLEALEPWYMTPEQTQVRMRADYDKYGRIFKIIGTRFE